MIEKFEIKSHDGPARLGKLEKIETPFLFNKNDLKISQSEGASYNIDYELAQWSVKESIKLAKENVESCNAAIIQGSKYVDLRLNCVEELEKMGYNIFLIANSDELLLHPRDLVETIVSIRQKIHPNSLLIYPFAESSFMPLLIYMGVDGFLDASTNYYSYLNVFMSPTKSYDLNKYPLFENITRKKLEEYNKKSLEFVIKEIKAHMKNKSLRNLVEERSNTTPQNISALKILDKNYMDYLLEY